MAPPPIPSISTLSTGGFWDARWWAFAGRSTRTWVSTSKPRRCRGKAAALGMVTQAMSELAEDDAELASVLDAAAEVTAP